MARPNTAAVRLLAGEREPVRVATTANITLSGLQTIDGVAVVAGTRVLVKNQTDATENGIYEASSGTWYRAADARSARTINKGVTVHVQSGTVNAGDVYAQQTLDPDIGEDDIVWTLYLSDSALSDIQDAIAEAQTVADNLIDQIQDAGAGILGSVTNPVFVNKAAAEAYDPDTAPAYIILLSYYNLTIGGAGTWEKLVSAPSPVELWHLQIAEGSWYQLRPTGPITPLQIGGRGDNSQAEEDYIDAAAIFAAGREVVVPVGRWRLDSPPSVWNFQVNMRGEGDGVGPGLTTDLNSTVFVVNFSAGDVFVASSLYSHTFQDFQFATSDSAHPRTSGAALTIQGPAAPSQGHNNMSKVRNVAFERQYVGLKLLRTFFPEVTGCHFGYWIDRGIDVGTSELTEGSGGWIHHNQFYTESGGTSDVAAITLRVGYTHVEKNIFVGSRYMLEILVSEGGAGANYVTGNWIENQGLCGIRAGSGDGSLAAMLTIEQNEFSNVAFTDDWLASILIDDYDSGTDWISEISIKNNVHRHVLASNQRFIWIQSGEGVEIAGERIRNIGVGTPIGVDVSSLSTAALKTPVRVRDCQMMGTFANQYIVNSKATWNVDQGLTFAVVNALTPANGSMVYVTDGTPNANPLTGSGTGAIAKRLNNVWRSD